MAGRFQTIPGTFDILPHAQGADVASSASWRFIEATVRTVLGRFGAQEIRTPILEPTELIARGIGQLTDIVSKEMFAFERGETSYVLRPEVTAPVMRAYLEHNLDQRGGTQRLFYIGPCFRAERPQKGRYRQFHQFGAELIGSDGPAADAEIIAMMMAVYSELGLGASTLKINTLGDEHSRPRYRDALTTYLEPFASDLSETSRQRLETNPLRILDTKSDSEQRILEGAPRLIDYVDDESRTHYEAVKGLLADFGVAFVEDHRLVRGLDYYTRTAFELEGAGLGSQSALAGGGRYDLLAVELGSKGPVPAVGFAAGMERLFLELAASGVELPAERGTDVFIVALGEAALSWALKQAQALRSSGVTVMTDLKARSMKAQMREANRQGAARVVIVGDAEIESGTVQLKHMDTGEQEPVAMPDLVRRLTV